MFILHTALRLVNKGIAKYLALDADCLQSLSDLGPKTLHIYLEKADIDFYINIDHGITLSRHHQGDITTSIKGTPQALLKLIIHKKTTGKLVAEGVSISGDLDVAQDLIQIMQAMDIDWHSFLSKFTGDMAAHQLLAQAKTFKQFLKKTRRRVQENMGEYLLEEARVVVPAVEIKHYCDQVTNLRHDVERLSQRLQRQQQAKDA